MITPALLILASGSLIATALVRLGRVVDRIRKLADVGNEPWVADEVNRQERRAFLAELALLFFFFAVTCFVISGLAIAIDHAFGNQLWWMPVVITTIGMTFIVAGCAAMVAETRVSMSQLRAEIGRLRA